MNIQPPKLEHGERYGKLRVIAKLKHGKYRCGCECGYQRVVARAAQLMKGKVKSCLKCQ